MARDDEGTEASGSKPGQAACPSPLRSVQPDIARSNYLLGLFGLLKERPPGVMTGFGSQDSRKTFVAQGSGLTRGDRNRNRRVDALRAVVRRDRAVLAVDLGERGGGAATWSAGAAALAAGRLAGAACLAGRYRGADDRAARGRRELSDLVPASLRDGQAGQGAWRPQRHASAPARKVTEALLLRSQDSGPSSIGSRLPSRNDCGYAYGDQRCHRSKRWRTTCVLCGLCGLCR